MLWSACQYVTLAGLVYVGVCQGEGQLKCSTLRLSTSKPYQFCLLWCCSAKEGRLSEAAQRGDRKTPQRAVAAKLAFVHCEIGRNLPVIALIESWGGGRGGGGARRYSLLKYNIVDTAGSIFSSPGCARQIQTLPPRLVWLPKIRPDRLAHAKGNSSKSTVFEQGLAISSLESARIEPLSHTACSQNIMMHVAGLQRKKLQFRNDVEGSFIPRKHKCIFNNCRHDIRHGCNFISGPHLDS
jgi:hypothetical protein